MDPTAGGLLLEQDAAYLRSVAVGEHDLPSRGGDIGDLLSGGSGRTVGVLVRIVLPAPKEGVPPEGNHDAFHTMKASYEPGTSR